MSVVDSGRSPVPAAAARWLQPAIVATVLAVGLIASWLGSTAYCIALGTGLIPADVPELPRVIERRSLSEARRMREGRGLDDPGILEYVVRFESSMGDATKYEWRLYGTGSILFKELGDGLASDAPAWASEASSTDWYRRGSPPPTCVVLEGGWPFRAFRAVAITYVPEGTNINGSATPDEEVDVHGGVAVFRWGRSSGAPLIDGEWPYVVIALCPNGRAFWFNWFMWSLSVAVLVVLVRMARWTARSRRRAAGLCPSCRYPLRAAQTPCPECGQE